MRKIALSLMSLMTLNSANAAEKSAFMWGVANSAFQVEGSPADSDWKRWTHTPNRIADNSNAETVSDFWTRYEEDFRLAQELGAKAFRVSIAWERVQPDYDKFDEDVLAHYEKMILKMRDYGLEPIVTLHHWALPIWLSDRGGLLFHGFPDLFVGFAEKVVNRLALGPAGVKWWMTFNEPMVQSTVGYVDGQFPPGVDPNKKMVDRLSDLNSARLHQIQAHIMAYNSLRKDSRLNFIKIGLAAHIREFFPFKDNFWDKQMAKGSHESFNQEFLDAVMTGNIRLTNPLQVTLSKWSTVEIDEKLEVPVGGTLDYLGINYYGRYMMEATDFKYKLPRGAQQHEGTNPWRTDMDWEIYPDGLSRMLEWAWTRYNLPIIVSENGLADESDTKRMKFIEKHVEQVEIAMRNGVNVFGYLYWSLTDNFEWSHGLKPRFGLVEIDYINNLARKPRPSYYEFQKFIALKSGKAPDLVSSTEAKPTAAR